MGMSIKQFAEEILGTSHESLKNREVFIKFITTPDRVVFDPHLFVNFEKQWGEGSLYHKDIAGANNIEKNRVTGGGFAAVSESSVRITGRSMEFGGIEGSEEMVKQFFENYFDCPVVI